jgi:shikimate kinase
VNGNVVLIGMPGAGKSTIGVLLAKRLGFDFVDSDVLIQLRQGEVLQDTLQALGYLALREIEEQVLVSLNVANTVIATGGSAVYSDRAMSHLSRGALVVYLAAKPAELERRIDDYDTRGIARRPDQSFTDLYAERTVLYQKYAHIAVDAAVGPETLVTQISSALKAGSAAGQIPAT